MSVSSTLEGALRSAATVTRSVSMRRKSACAQGCAQPTESRRDGRFDCVLVDLTVADREQPARVEQPQVPGHQFGANRDDRGRQAGAVGPSLGAFASILLAEQIDDDVPAGRPCGREVAHETPLRHRRGGGAEHLDRQPERQPARPPVGEVEERVEVALDQPARIVLQVTPLVGVDEAGGRDQGSGRDRPQLGLLVQGRRLVDRHEFVVLVLAHRRQSSGLVDVDPPAKRPPADGRGPGSVP
ncbi:hypothetical protein [Geodermatophilus sp. TF02-6]|uniref:hypothetical protein n=1 Tax=Geodermatophilus sp. TF02-6 TaxID=2250575 RepID=UPI0011BF8FED|nr:hypothetical protein [Geodermatophilus sp. TF02-6]